MKIEISEAQLLKLVEKQLSSLFMYDGECEGERLSRACARSLGRCEFCFGHTASKYYQKGNEVYFNPFHSGQYTIFLYYLSNEVFRLAGNSNTLSDRIYYLNKCLNGLDLFYEVEMPRVFFLDHPVGSVMGRATYGEEFSFTQNCTVGNNKGKYPTIGRNVKMMSGSKVLGGCTIGDNVVLSANTYVKDCDIPACSLVFGASPSLVIKSREPTHVERPGLG